MTSVLIAGSGGQGILLLGKILAQAAMREGRNVTWFPSYGAEVRGGTANCTVIVSDRMIGSPIITNPDVLVVMNDQSLEKFAPRLKKGGILLQDDSLVRGCWNGECSSLGVPATEIATSLGFPKAANVVMLGALVTRTGITDFDSVLAAMDELAPPSKRHLLAVNVEALRAGKAFVEDKKGRDSGR